MSDINKTIAELKATGAADSLDLIVQAIREEDPAATSVLISVLEWQAARLRRKELR